MKMLQLRTPAGFQRHVNKDIDYEFMEFSRQGITSRLLLWKHTISRGMPGIAFFSGTIKGIVTRPLDLGGNKGYDVRVTDASGHVSRWVGSFYTYVVYEHADQRIMRLFDEVITNMCYY
jgi:hypothetical protein